MSNTNTNRRLSVTRNQPDPAGAEDVDLDYVYEKGNTHLTLSFGATRDFSTSKSKENLMLELEGEWNAFLRAMRQEGLISDSSSKEITGVPQSTYPAIATGQLNTAAGFPSGPPYLELG